MPTWFYVALGLYVFSLVCFNDNLIGPIWHTTSFETRGKGEDASDLGMPMPYLGDGVRRRR